MIRTNRQIIIALITALAAVVFIAIVVVSTVGTDVFFRSDTEHSRLIDQNDDNHDAVGLAALPTTVGVWGTDTETTVKEEDDSIAPNRIIIASLGINAPVVSVGVTKAGAMATPGNYASVGWYKFGTLPGETGSAVLAGHVDNGLALPGVFKRLKEIQPEAKITVTLNDGTSYTFSVISIHTYNYKEAPTEEIFSQNDGKYIKLITCTGTLIRSEHTYDERLVVTARLVE